jgi:eukaryotic-like serine/threonine-protein kinase
VALKMLSETAAANPEANARFLQEARLASSISHPNIISVLDFGDEYGIPYMVMELLEGESLRQAMDQHHTGDLSRRLRLALQLGRALENIHERKIVHRDVKPDNVHVDGAGNIKLMDFGIAKAHDVQLTRVGFTLGTPYYMAPEQIRGGVISAQTDVYSFGVLLYELLCGKKPFQGADYEKVFEQSINQPADLAPLRAAGVSEPAIDLISLMLAKLPAIRPQGMGAVCEDLERILTNLPVIAAPAPVAAAAVKTAPVKPVQKKRVKKLSTSGLPAPLDALPEALQSANGLIVVSALAVLLVFGALILILRAMGVL